MDTLTIAILDSILDGTISDQMYTLCLPAIERILGQEAEQGSFP